MEGTEEALVEQVGVKMEGGGWKEESRSILIALAEQVGVKCEDGGEGSKWKEEFVHNVKVRGRTGDPRETKRDCDEDSDPPEMPTCERTKVRRNSSRRSIVATTQVATT